MKIFKKDGVRDILGCIVALVISLLLKYYKFNNFSIVLAVILVSAMTIIFIYSKKRTKDYWEKTLVIALFWSAASIVWIDDWVNICEQIFKIVITVGYIFLACAASDFFND